MKDRRHGITLRWRAMALALGILWLVVGQACGKKVTVDFTVQRLDPVVLTDASSTSLVALNTSSPQPLPKGKRVQTRSGGQALLRGQLSTNATCQIYIFPQGSLVTHGCDKSKYQGSSTVTCQEENTAVYKKCRGNLQETGSAEVTVTGTWLAMTYLPEQQLTVVAVADGTAQVAPVTGFADRRLGRSERVGAQEFLFTAPDDRLGELAGLGLPVRQPLPLSNLPVLLDTFDLWPWYGPVIDRAREDGVDFPIEPGSERPEGLFAVHGAGFALNDERIQEAIAHGVDWESMLRSVFPNEEPVARLDFPGRAAATGQFPFDPEAAIELLASADWSQEQRVALVAAAEDDPLAVASEWMLGYLSEIGMQIDYFVEPAEEAFSIIEEYLASDEPVLWLAWD